MAQLMLTFILTPKQSSTLVRVRSGGSRLKMVSGI